MTTSNQPDIQTDEDMMREICRLQEEEEAFDLEQGLSPVDLGVTPVEQFDDDGDLLNGVEAPDLGTLTARKLNGVVGDGDRDPTQPGKDKKWFKLAQLIDDRACWLFQPAGSMSLAINSVKLDLFEFVPKECGYGVIARKENKKTGQINYTLTFNRLAQLQILPHVVDLMVRGRNCALAAYEYQGLFEGPGKRSNIHVKNLRYFLREYIQSGGGRGEFVSPKERYLKGHY